MKANHNSTNFFHFDDGVVVNISSSKNESKSQRRGCLGAKNLCCCKYQ